MAICRDKTISRESILSLACWAARSCVIKTCQLKRQDGYTVSVMRGTITLEAGGIKVKAHWRAEQLAANDQHPDMMSVEIDPTYRLLLEGVTPVDDNGHMLSSWEVQDIARVIMNNTKGVWEAKVRHVVRG